LQNIAKNRNKYKKSVDIFFVFLYIMHSSNNYKKGRFSSSFSGPFFILKQKVCLHKSLETIDKV